MKTAYYARPMSIYKSPQEDRDIETIAKLGYGVVELHKKELQEAAKARGMEVFKDLVRRADALFFRSFIDGKIGAGVKQEIEWALEAGLPVAELPSRIDQRGLSVEATRAVLAELGQR